MNCEHFRRARYYNFDGNHNSGINSKVKLTNNFFAILYINIIQLLLF